MQGGIESLTGFTKQFIVSNKNFKWWWFALMSLEKYADFADLATFTVLI